MTTAPTNVSERLVEVSGLRIRVQQAGSGEPLVVMHQDIGTLGIEAPFLQTLARQFTVVLPTHPGFDSQDLPGWARHPRDIGLMHLWLLEELGLDSINLVGLGFGGWIAAEMATMNQHLIRKLVLSGAAGVKPVQGEIMDEFVMSSAEYVSAGFQNKATFAELFGAEPSIDQLETWEVNREMTTRIAWKPYMFNPSLPHLLGGVRTPTLLVWGKDDAVVPLSSAEEYRRLIPGAKLELFGECGHYPEFEQPEKLAKLVGDFVAVG